ncbi:MAG: hypothetical protein ACRBCS_08710 [Cellvibrionaceae bacterium]
MINIPSTVPTANTEGVKATSLKGERVARIEKLQDVTDKPDSRKMPRKKHKNRQKEVASEDTTRQDYVDSPKPLSDVPLTTYEFQSRNAVRSNDRRHRFDRRKKNSKNFLFDSRASNTRRSNDSRYPSVDIEV